MPTTADALRTRRPSPLDRMSETYPKRTAIIYLGESFSYRRLRDLSERSPVRCVRPRVVRKATG